MHPVPPVLTPERIDAMLSRMAEICMAAVEEAGQRLKAAPDDEAFERGGRTLQRTCRNLRQTIALKQRFDRDQLRSAVDRRREAEAGGKAAGEAGRAVIARVRNHFERVLWDEYEPGEAQEIYDDIDDRLDDLGLEGKLLATPVETLIVQLGKQFGVTGKKAPSEPAPKATASKPPPAPPSRAKAAAEPTPSPEPPPADPPPRPIEAAPPPEPAPEPYVPPWERAPPGRLIPGGSGW